MNTLPLQQLHHHEEQAFFQHTEIKESHKVWMVQLCEDPRFSDESFRQFGVFQMLAMDDLDGSFFLKINMACAVDGAHPPLSDDLEYFVFAYPAAYETVPLLLRHRSVPLKS
jgi:hypothetical protein